MRLQRRALIEAYIKVPEQSKNGKQHLHVLFRGQYIAQAYISELWNQIHHAKVVDIRAVGKRRSKRALAAYMAKYLSKENIFRYSWSWSWVWRGFCRHWDRLKRLWRYYDYLGGPMPFSNLIWLWRYFLHRRTPKLIITYLAKWEPTKEQYAKLPAT